MLILWGIVAICVVYGLIKLIDRRDARRQEKARQEAARKAAEEEAARQQKIKKAMEAIEQKIDDAIAAVPGSEAYRVPESYEYTEAEALTVTQFTPVSRRRFVAFDLETTGLDPAADEIVEIGAVRVENGVITERYQQLVDPGFDMPKRAAAVNHITDEMLSGQPRIYAALPSFLAFVGDDVLAAHNASFDSRFLAHACMRHRFRYPVRFFDTMRLARYWPSAEDKKLVTLIASAGIERDRSHRALSDAEAVAKLILATNEKRKNGAVKND